MKIKNLFFLIILSIFCSGHIIGQNTTINDVVKFRLKNVGPIVSESEVSGYYMFYETDRISRKVRAYELLIMDQNLNTISTHTIEGSKYTFMLDAGFNNKHLMIKLYDYKEKTITFKEFNDQAEVINTITREVGRYERFVISQTLGNDDAGVAPNMHPVKNIGFVDYRDDKNRKVGYVIDFYPTNGGKKWTVKAAEDLKLHETASFIYGDENVIISSVMQKKNMLTSDVEASILAIDTKTGKTLYKKKLDHELFDLFVLSGLESDNDGNVHLFGTFYNKGKSELNNPSLGLFAIKLDNKGNFISENFMSWANDLSKFVDVNHKGKIKDAGYLYIHDIVKDAQGNVFVVGEQFRKVVDGLGVAAALLGADASMAKVVIEDLTIIELDSDYKIKGLNIIDKEKSNFHFEAGYELYGPQVLSNVVKYNGGFDYEFTQFNSDRSVITIGYVDYVKVKGSPNKFVLGSVNYTDGERSHDEMDLKTVRERKAIEVLPGKSGNYVIMEYNSKDNTLSFRLEKIVL